MSRRCTAVSAAPIMPEVNVSASGSPPVPGTESRPEGLPIATKSGASRRISGRSEAVTGESARGSLSKATPSRRRSARGLTVVRAESVMPLHLTS